MIEGDVVEIIVSLPTQLFLNTPIPCSLWILTNNKTQNGRDRRKETLFINASSLGKMKTRILKTLSNEDIQKIANTVFSWRKNENYTDIEGFCKSSNNNDIKNNDYVLTPGRYVGYKEEDDDETNFEEKINNLIKELNHITKESEDLSLKIKNVLIDINKKDAN